MLMIFAFHERNYCPSGRACSTLRGVVKQRKKGASRELHINHGQSTFYEAVVVEGTVAVVTAGFWVVATFLWYNLAAMQSAAATTASQKDHWNPADRKTLMVTPDAKGIGNVLVAEPIKGRLKSNIA